MIISRNYAKRLINKGLAKVVTFQVDSGTEEIMLVINRLDLCRTDHFYATEQDIQKHLKKQ